MPHIDADERKKYHREYMRDYAVEKRKGLAQSIHAALLQLQLWEASKWR